METEKTNWRKEELHTNILLPCAIADDKEMDAIYFADEKYEILEPNLDRILDNVIY